ncbi:hypothetical protein [Haliscomenobacter sp.]|uniref:hypothetical protein n=1 Tax=Haliscomenobacter sp. TaxID=2717303 RepID=UPI0035933F64
MSQSLTIPKNPVYPPSMDWPLLRREGIKHIERLGSACWTDFNAHDPGITMLEVLCYALTDLGYRSNFSSADLFSVGDKVNFFTAQYVLPNDPVTALDLRRVLIDIPGVRNVWVEQMEEPEVRFKLRESVAHEMPKQRLEQYWKLINSTPRVFPSINFSWPTTIDQLIVDIKKCQDDKTESNARINLKKELTTSATRTLAGKLLEKTFLLYMADNYMAESAYFIEEEIAKGINVEAKERFLLKGLKDLSFALGLKDEAAKKEKIKEIFDQDFSGVKLDSIAEMHQDFFFSQPLLFLLLLDSLGFDKHPPDLPSPDFYYNLFIPQGIYTIYLDIEETHLGSTRDIEAAALHRLHQYRNLGEDIAPSLKILEKKPLGIDLQLELKPSAIPAEVLAEVYLAIEDYLIPPVHFYSLEGMLNKYGSFSLNPAAFERLVDANLPSEAINALQPLQDKVHQGIQNFEAAVRNLLSKADFEDYWPQIFVSTDKRYDAHPVYQGPMLEHGFIDEAELLHSQPRQTIYRSDLYQRIMAVPGVVQVENLELFFCEEKDQKFNYKNRWCLEMNCRCLPDLDLKCSEWRVGKGPISVQINQLDIEDALQLRRRNEKINRLGSLDLSAPKGQDFGNLQEYTSIQEDLPRTYKVGRTGMASREFDLRKAQAKQLQAYLFFYDQILANYLAHLDQVRQALSIEGQTTGMTQPSLYQTLYEIPGIKDILTAFDGSLDWENFTDKPDNDYRKALNEGVTGSLTQRQLRQDEILNHLLARFGEQFTDYVLGLYEIERPIDAKALLEGSLSDWIADKQNLLAAAPFLSSRRGTAFNYRAEVQGDNTHFWNSPNVEGLKKRVCALLGIEDATRHTITCEPGFFLGVEPLSLSTKSSARSRNKYEFFIKTNEDSATRLLVSTAKFSSMEGAQIACQDFLNHAADTNNYGVIDSTVGFWSPTETQRTMNNALLLETKFVRQLEASDPEQRLKQIQELAIANCQDDSFHLIEHILLRPRNEAYTKVLRPRVFDLEYPELLDPYSFWVTVVVPEWVERFKDKRLLQHFEQTLRSEAPAHLAIHIQPLNREKMLEFEKVYYEWLHALCSTEQENLASSTDALVEKMKEWDLPAQV